MVGLAATVEIRVGSALQTLRAMVAAQAEAFNLISIDADRQNYPGYLEWPLKLSQPGTVIVADNVVRAAAILDPAGTDPHLGEGGVQGIRRFHELVASDPRLTATAIQTVGVEGHAGFALALVL
jgi:predicted O-methyltransferase YrrM